MENHTHIARTIESQIGNRALYMIGAKHLTMVENGLTFRVTCRGAKANMITVTLDPSDTYTFKAEKVTSPRYSRTTGKYTTAKVRTVVECSDVHAGMLRDLVAHATGLAVAL
jgi:hypothetical protein